MKRALSVVSLLTAFAPVVFAGSPFTGWGKDPNEAMIAAMENARKKSKGGCLCKGLTVDNIDEKCRPALNGFVCEACGANHKGSCESGGEVEKAFKKLRGQ